MIKKPRLNSKEIKVLRALEFDADKSIETIRRESGLSEHSIRYHQHRLLLSNTIRRTPVIDLSCQGYNYVGIYFNPSLREQNLKQIILRSILPLNEIVWLAEFVGEYRFGMAIAGRDLSTIDRTLTKLSDKFPRLFHSKSVAHQLTATYLPRKYLMESSPRKGIPSIEISSTNESADLDRLDKRILANFAQDGSLSRRKLAQKLGTPLTTIDYRFERLRKSGAIKGFTYSFSASTFDRHSFMILVFGNGMGSAFTNLVRDFAVRHPDIVSLYRCLGWWDFELDIEAESHAKVLEIADQLTMIGKDWISSIKILSGVRTLKHTMVPFSPDQ